MLFHRNSEGVDNKTCMDLKNCNFQARVIVQLVRAPAAKPQDLSSISRPHKVEGKTDSCKLSSVFHTCVHRHITK